MGGGFGEIAERFAVFGTCRRCTRLSGIAAACALAVAAMAVAALGPSLVALATCLLAAICCALWIAHRVAAGRRNTVLRLLKAFGADRGEARAVIGAFPPSPEFDDLRAGRLRAGESVTVSRSPHPVASGFRISRVVVTSGREVLTEVARTDDGRFAAVDSAPDCP